MAYRNGTYIAFNGMGTTDPTKSDMKYYGLLQKWNKSTGHDFSFSDSHKKTYQVSDNSSKETLKKRLLERLSKSKHMLLIISENSSVNRGLLNREIDKAVKTYKIPIIVVYTGYTSILSPNSLSDLLPSKLQELIKSEEANTIHIAFKQKIIELAINEFDINNLPPYTVTHYLKSVYDNNL